MIFQTRCLFIIYCFNVFHTTESQGPNGGRFLFMGKMKQDEKCFTISKTTTSFIIDDIVKSYAEYSHNRNQDESFMLMNFMMNMISAEYNVPKECYRQNSMKLMYIAYIATEYMYNLTLCTIWSRTNSDNEEIRRLSSIPVFHNLNLHEIFNSCKWTLTMFGGFMKTYSEVINNLKTDSDREANDIIFTIKSKISECANIIYPTSEVLMNMNDNGEPFNDHFNHAFLSTIRNNAVCLETIRPYFNSSITNTSRMDFRSHILEAKTYHISEEERFLWRNVVNIFNTYGTDMHPFRILSKCEEFRNELVFYAAGEIPYINPFDTQINYSHEKFNVMFDPYRQIFFFPYH